MDTPDAGRNYRPLGFSMLAASILLTVGLNLWSVPAAFTVAVGFFIVVLGAYYLVHRRARPTPRRESRNLPS